MWCLYNEDFEIFGICESLNTARAAQAYVQTETASNIYLLMNETESLLASIHQLKMEDLANG
jgi:uncharacterized membrane protein